MRRAAALTALLLCPLAAAAQQVPEVTDIPRPAIDRLAERGPLDLVRAWRADFDGNGTQALSVQAARPAGGNAVWLEHGVDDGAAFRAFGEDMALPGGIKRVVLGRDGVVVTVHRMLDGDARCCPSGETDVTWRP